MPEIPAQSVARNGRYLLPDRGGTTLRLRGRIGFSSGAVVALLLSSLVGAHAAAAASPPSDAPAGSVTTYQTNSVHDGHSTDELSFPLGEHWTHDFGAQARVSYPVVVDGRVFVATSTPGGAYGADLWALDASDGAVLWGPIAVGGTYYLEGLAADGTNVYTVSFNGFMEAIDQATGAQVWSALLPGQWSFTSPPTVHGGEVYVGGAGSGGTLYAVNAASGNVDWTASVMNGDHSSPAVTDDGVYVSYACEVSYKFDPATGANLWTHTTGCEGGGGRTPVVHGDAVYVRDDAGMGPAVLSATTGAQVNTFTSTTAPAISDTSMFTLTAGTLRAVDLATNVVQWSQAGDGGLVTAPIIVGSSVIVGSSTGTVFAYDTTNGKQIWSGSAGEPIVAPEEHNATMLVGLAEADDTLFVPAGNTLVAFTADDVSAAPTAVSFGKQRVGTYGLAKTVTISNTGGAPETLTDLQLTGANSNDFFGATNCFPAGVPGTLAPHSTCRVELYGAPLALGTRAANLVVTSSAGGPPDVVSLSVTGTEGYFLAGAHGEIATFGDAVFHGDATHIGLTAPIISIATTPNGAGYWLLGRDGGIFSYGNARFYGSTGAMRLTNPIVGMTPTPTGHGYWLVASDGGVFSFGDARFYGSTGAIRLRRPVVGMASTLDGHGYWLVADDGGLFAFGDANFYGSAAGAQLSAPIARVVATPAGRGYWLQARDGHRYTYGDARRFGSVPAGRTIVGFAPTPDGRGYWTASNTGIVDAFGDAPAYGNLPVRGVTDVIGLAATAPPLPPSLLPYAATSTSGAAATNNAPHAERLESTRSRPALSALPAGS
jgi:outer membrane protein assembly factor BamB